MNFLSVVARQESDFSINFIIQASTLFIDDCENMSRTLVCGSLIQLLSGILCDDDGIWR